MEGKGSPWDLARDANTRLVKLWLSHKQDIYSLSGRSTQGSLLKGEGYNLKGTGIRTYAASR